MKFLSILMMLLIVGGCIPMNDAVFKQSSNYGNDPIVKLTQREASDLFEMPETLFIAKRAGFQEYQKVALKAYNGDRESLERYLQKTVGMGWENAATEGYVGDLNMMLKRWGDFQFSQVILSLNNQQQKSLKAYVYLAEYLGYAEKGEIDSKYQKIAQILRKHR